MILLVNACVRHMSRTLALATNTAKTISDKFTVLNLYEQDLKPLDYDGLLRREKFIEKSDFSDDMFRLAKEFKEADEIIIAAPYWDLSFPSVLKCYIEAICINGLTFFYNDNGIPQGLCKANRVVYVTTAGGFISENNLGYDYVSRLFKGLFDIKNTVCIKAEGLDIQGADVKEIIKSAQNEAKRILNG